MPEENAVRSARAPLLNLSRGGWLFASAILFALLLALDYGLNGRPRMAVAYVLPVLMLTWALGGTSGIVGAAAVCSLLIWSDYISGTATSAASYPERLVMFATYAVLVVACASVRRAFEGARVMASRDVLTGLINKGGFYHVVNAEMEQSRRYRRTLSVVYIDCDNFKAVNDRFGHEVGDECLQIIAQTMVRRLRASDVVARLGGDEFAVLLPETGANPSCWVIEMLQAQLVEEMREHGWPVTFSIGIATFVKMPRAIDDVIRHADRLMYEVKRRTKAGIRQEVFNGN